MPENVSNIPSPIKHCPVLVKPHHHTWPPLIFSFHAAVVDSTQPLPQRTNTKMKDARMWEHEIKLVKQDVIVGEGKRGDIINMVLEAEIQPKGRKKRNLSEKQQKVLDFIAEAQSGKIADLPLRFEGGILHRLNLVPTLVSLGIDQRKHIDRNLESLEKRGDIKIVDNIVSL